MLLAATLEYGLPLVEMYFKSLCRQPTMPRSKFLVVWYDSACPLCKREIALMRRLDRAGRIDFVDANDLDVTCPMDRAQILSRFHALENGAILSGAAAFAAIWRAIPILWPLGQFARIPMIERLLELAYVRFLKVRPRLQEWLR